VIRSFVMAAGVWQSSAGRLERLRQNGSDIAGFPLDSAPVTSTAGLGD
jgi:hypothetical protein